MEKFLSPECVLVSNVHKKYLQWFGKNKPLWKEDVEKMITVASNGKIRAFHTFFDSPKEAMSFTMNMQALCEYDVQMMYPMFSDEIKNVSQGHFFYIFTCNGGLGEGQAFIAQTILG